MTARQLRALTRQVSGPGFSRAANRAKRFVLAAAGTARSEAEREKSAVAKAQSN